VPEGLEAEIYRRAVERAVGRTVTAVTVDERQPSAGELRTVLRGRTVTGARRRGKHVLVDLDGLTLGLHFGMTGRLIVDGAAAIDRLEYGSGRDDPAWDRLTVSLSGGGHLRVNDPRRWARFVVDPDLSALGPDFLTLTTGELAAACASRRAPIKAVLLDQTSVAGFGNMCVDEVLWHAGVAPARPARSLARGEITAISRGSRRHLPAMLRRGGSHTGTIDPSVRAALPPCPRDGVALRRTVVGGRATVWCPAHQH
jgi:formamidopyrimidine-DNA glycosylase